MRSATARIVGRRAVSPVAALVAVLVAAALVAAGLTVPAAGPARATQPIMFGAYPSPRSGETPQTAVQRLESVAGRPLDSIRVFYKWDEPFPTSYETWLRSTGHRLIVSVKARRVDKTSVPWSAVAAAQPGSAVYADIVRWADAVRDFGAPIYVTFNHEPEAASNVDLGTATDYIAAWRRWVDIFRAEGATNARFMWIMTSWAFAVDSSDRRQAVKWYPGDAYVDGIAGDAYNWYTCRTDAPAVKWQSLQQLIAPQRTFWLGHQSKEDWITEYGTVEDPNDATRKAQWLTDARALFKTADYAHVTGVQLFEHDKTRPTCAWDEDTSVAARTAWTAWGQDPYYGGPDTTVPTAPGKPVGSSPSAGTVSLSWAAATDPDDSSLTYRVYRDGGASAIGTVTSSAASVTLTDSGLAAGSQHTYTVTASDARNTGPPSPASDPVTVSGSTAVLSDGFDGGLGAWTGSGMTLDQAVGASRPPSAAGNAVGTKAYLQRALPATYPSLCLSSAVWLVSHSGTVTLMKLRTAAAGPISRVLVDAANVIYARNDVAGTTLRTTGTLGTGWHTVTLCTTTGAGGQISVRLDGALVGSWTTSTGTEPIGMVRIGEDAASTYSGRFDDVLAT